MRRVTIFTWSIVLAFLWVSRPSALLADEQKIETIDGLWKGFDQSAVRDVWTVGARSIRCGACGPGRLGPGRGELSRLGPRAQCIAATTRRPQPPLRGLIPPIRRVG